MKNINKAGFSMIELIGAMIIIAILTIAGGVAINSSIKRANIDSTTAQLQVFASDMEAILEDIGVLEFKNGESSTVKKAKIEQFLTEIEDGYAHTYFDRASIVVSANNFKVSTGDMKDSWDSQFTLIYNTNPAKGSVGSCIFASPGPNMILEDNGYGTSVFADDILLIVSPK